MEDLPSNMPQGAYGLYEPEGFSIWINQQYQSELSVKNTGVLSHEFTHYVHSLSTIHSIDDLISLLFFVHAGIQRLEELSVPVSLPLSRWSAVNDCPPEIKNYVEGMDARRFRIKESLGLRLDPAPPATEQNGCLYSNGGKLFIKTSSVTGVPVARLALMEGAALAKKCEALGNDSDLKAKKNNPALSHYYAVHDCCSLTNPWIDPLSASALLCDISLCSLYPSQVFKSGIEILSELPASATLNDFEISLMQLYDQECRRWMNSRLAALEQARDLLPENHRSEENPSWAHLLLLNAISAVRLRQEYPFSLIKPVYLGWELFELAKVVGSPVILTNDMRLTSLAVTSNEVSLARDAVRTLSYICRWLLEDVGPLQCPYAGCPGCPKDRVGEHCFTNASLALIPSDDKPWCALLSSAHQLRVAHLLRREVIRG